MRQKPHRTAVALSFVGAFMGATLACAQSTGPAGSWYWCEPSHAYYPYVKICAAPWREVAPQTSSQGAQATAHPVPLTANAQPVATRAADALTAVPASGDSSTGVTPKDRNCLATNRKTVDLPLETCLSIGGTPKTGNVPCRAPNGAVAQMDVAVCRSIGGKIDRPENKPKPDEKAPSAPSQAAGTPANQSTPSSPSSSPPSPHSTPRLTMSEEDSIRHKIEECWSIPTDAPPNKGSNAVTIRLKLNPDGAILQASVVDTARMESDTYYRAAAESALRAVLDPKCSPLHLPPEKYDTWKDMTLSFDPRDLA